MKNSIIQSITASQRQGKDDNTRKIQIVGRHREPILSGNTTSTILPKIIGRYLQNMVIYVCKQQDIKIVQAQLGNQDVQK